MIPQYLESGEMNPQWLMERQGKMGASLFPLICKDGRKKGEVSQGMLTEAKKLAAERMTGFSVNRANPNDPNIIRGHELEPIAAAAYSIHTGKLLSRGPHWVEHPRIPLSGATPDGWVDGGGQIQIKAPRWDNFVQIVADGAIPKDVEMQMLWECAVTGEPWSDYVAYCEDMPEGKQIWIRRYEPTAEQIEWAEEKTRIFLAAVEKIFETVTENLACQA